MGRVINTNSDLKKSPDVYLTEKEGSKFVGRLKKRFESKVYAGKFSYLFTVEDTDASTRIWDKETKTESEVEIAVGDSVFIKGTTMLDRALAQVKDGERVEIVYKGKGNATKGRKPPFLFDVTVLD